MLRLHRAFALIGLLLLGQSAYAEKLRLVADAWPPFTDATLVNGGLATDIVSTALARAGYASEFEQVPWARALLGVGEGRYDVLVNAWFNEARTQLGQFSSEYLVNRVRFIRRKDAPIEYTNLKQLHEYPIAVVRGYAYSPDFDSDPELQKVLVHNFAMAVRMLAADRVKLTLEDEYVARYYLARESPRVRNAVEFLPNSLSENGLHILVSLKNPEHEQIVAKFDREIEAMKADGSYDRLLRQHGM
ncbi:substrate-binding periplasmic protein [Pseudomonas chlororaphis]|jgi:polar amino acid transport system substrate-binding protein|uniref:Transporter substrate-binding domain-containing protein n=1 Tax=Pseudomonas chlororaphis subsp. aurantiaca TaxID=86192 RepID=A0AAJ0ZKY5_9PSED|nr:transporter substrate-binding domain-containing protein [Pseudomonas chlororaphis]AIC23331.1 amino acid ABC transporter substrate-binding protein [Pseudomonas chlororaphis]AZD51290.1 amino acid ABC transporter, periplasmic amino acid-binding protein, putative [Pseudomonas chlororaphis subsp. aurantiaca]AZD69932.1 amino acid ABC transporter, periplasmic amino acid-binding protein, putative [Pseudomonas chlororaphis subsp. aurantiaca]AZD82381.1 amino acid ABC transporter, periplasmic amino aci